MYQPLLLYQAGSAQLDFYLIKEMPFFDLTIQCVESSDFGPKSDDLGHRILKSDFVPSDFAKSDVFQLFVKSDCISRPMFSSDRKIKIRSLESDRIINGLRQK